MQDHRSRFLGSATTGSLMDLRAGFGDGRRERPRRLAEARAPPPASAFLRQRNERASVGRRGDRETSAPHWGDGETEKRACLTGETARPRGEPREHPVTMGRPLRGRGSTDLIKQNSKESEETECEV